MRSSVSLPFFVLFFCFLGNLATNPQWSSQLDDISHVFRAVLFFLSFGMFIYFFDKPLFKKTKALKIIILFWIFFWFFNITGMLVKIFNSEIRFEAVLFYTDYINIFMMSALISIYVIKIISKKDPENLPKFSTPVVLSCIIVFTGITTATLYLHGNIILSVINAAMFILNYFTLATILSSKIRTLVRRNYTTASFILLLNSSFHITFFLRSKMNTDNFYYFIFQILVFFLVASQVYMDSLHRFRSVKKISLQLANKLGDLTVRHLEAHRAQKAKETFLATMSHEIRTPVNGIIGNAELFELTKIDQDQRRLLNMIKTSAGNLTLLVDDVLDLPDLVMGRFHIDKKPVSLMGLLESVIDVLTPRSFEKNLDLTYFVDPLAPEYILGDKKRIGQIILNLANNALKFTEKGEVFLGISVLNPDNLDGTAELVFEVKDTGPGIPEDRLNRLFKAYVQTDASVARVYGGTGLGLAISKQLVEKMEGTIGVESKEGEGSRFFFQASFQTEGTQKISDIYPNPAPHCKKVLFLSKNPTLRKIVTHYFEHWSLEVTATDDCSAVLSDFQNGKFDFALLDLSSLEASSCEDVLKKNARSRKNKTPTGALTIMGKKSLQEMEKLVDVVLMKPVKIKHLVSATHKLDALQHKGKIEKQLKENHKMEEKNEQKQSTGDKSHMTILVVEDNQVNQKLILSLIKKLGYQSALAENGQISVDMTEADDYDLVLMDLQMPVMDGLTASRNIVANFEKSGRKKPFIVALTANVMMGDKEKCLDAGMDDYLTKPIQMKVLDEVLKKWLGE